ncbi:DUF6352 family protein [Bradyrhizobium sp. RDT10]
MSRWPAKGPAICRRSSCRNRCHLILRNALEGCDDPYVLRAAELLYRSQLAAVHDGTLLLADAGGDRGGATPPRTTCTCRR